MPVSTTLLPPELLDQLSQAAKALNVPKNRLLADALRLYFKEKRKRDYIVGLEKTATLLEDDEWAEEGFQEWVDH